jgi:hypothetical protein
MLTVLGLAALLSLEAFGQRGGARGGGARGGGARVGPVGGGARVAPAGGGARVGPVGGGTIQSYGARPGGGGYKATAPIVGPGGGVGQAGKAGGSYTTKGGTTINAKGGAVGGTTPGGVQGGKYVGGINVTTPGGREVTKVGQGGAVAGPGGNVVGGKSGATVGSGPYGAYGSKYQGGVAVGPQGGVAGKTQIGGAAGPGGAVFGAGRAGAAGGGYGAVAGKTTAVAGYRGTYYRSSAAIRTQGGYVRGAVVNYPCFRPGWYTSHPGAWFAAGWAAGYVWRAATWPACSGYCGIALPPVYYNYGENIVYQDNGIYMDGQQVATTEEYAQQATALADVGRNTNTTTKEEWLPLGVFALVQGDEKVSNHIFQLAVNKEGIIRGNYYDAVTDTTQPVYGSVDKKTQRAAWTVGDRKTPVYEVGFANLTQDETTMVVHYGTERTQQYTLIRVEEPENTK